MQSSTNGLWQARKKGIREVIKRRRECDKDGYRRELESGWKMRIRELDGLRGIAILVVVAYHYMSWLPATGAQLGWLGVDLFFVLSGFLITTILVNLRGSEHYFSVFYARRALRIFPLYYLAVGIYLASCLVSGMAGSPRLWAGYIFYYSSLLSGQNKNVMATSLALGVSSGLAVLWSLSVEEIYYTIWA